MHFGEGDYEASEQAVRSLLAEAGAGDLGGMTKARVEQPSQGVTTPESYLGALRAARFANLAPGRALPVGPAEFSLPRGPLPPDELASAGRWQIRPEDATALSGARLDLNFGARRVFLVMGSPGEARRVRVYLDGKPIPASAEGADVHHGVVTVEAQRLYRLVDLPRVERHVLELRFERGVSGYAFTFG